MSKENKPNTNLLANQTAKPRTERPPFEVVKWRDRFTAVLAAPVKRQNAPPSQPAPVPFEMTEDELCEVEMHSEWRGDFRIRPISKEWRHAGRKPAYRTAVCNVAYIWRDGDAIDAFGKMPDSFSQRGYELRACGLSLPGSAPKWASEGYRVWEEADANAAATGDNTSAPGWHVVGEIPTAISPNKWESLVVGFVERQLSGRGAVVAWAIHALEGDNGEWIVRPHFHLVVTLLHWRHRKGRFGKRHPSWLSNRRAHKRLEVAWRYCCEGAKLNRWVRSDQRGPVELITPPSAVSGG